jgi:hypothetical protein
MAAKNSKLAAQFYADASTSGAAAGGLFDGVSIFVDGFTVPSSQVTAARHQFMLISRVLIHHNLITVDATVSIMSI